MSDFVYWYDILMLAVLVACVVVGVWKGMAWQLATLASVFLSGFVAVGGATAIAPYFNVDSQWDHVLAMLVIYVVTAGAIWVVFRLISKIIDRVQMKDFDRQLGGVFGLAKGVGYCVILTFFAVTLSEPARQAILQSRSGQYISRGIHRANPVLPANVRALLGKYIDELDKKLTAPSQATTQATMTPQSDGSLRSAAAPGGSVSSGGSPGNL